MPERLRITVLGLSLSSSWGNGHATTYRGLLREFAARGHHVTFLERNVPWYAAERDMPEPDFCSFHLYENVEELRDSFEYLVTSADVVIVGSYVPEGVTVANWVKEKAKGIMAFYDIDTPVTLAKLRDGDYEYICPSLIRKFDLYLSFTGGPMLDRIEQELGCPWAAPLYCSFDPNLYYPEASETLWDLGYMGTYSPDRQPTLEELLIEPARQWPSGLFVVAGPRYPDNVNWPANLQRIEHLAPPEHRSFYNSQRFTLNVTRADMILAGYSPSVRLFEASACGTPVISDYWNGLEDFFVPGVEILTAETRVDALRIVQDLPEQERLRIGERARARVMAEHTAGHRAAELEAYCREAMERSSRSQFSTDSARSM
jgi:spore maturation protein CgeB